MKETSMNKRLKKCESPDCERLTLRKFCAWHDHERYEQRLAKKPRWLQQYRGMMTLNEERTKDE
jgi:hypothetical protein